MMSRKLSALAAALLAAIATAAEAVSLGDLQVKSRPGQPLEATLEIRDVDVTISPLLVRVAPPATYVREGVNWPVEAQDLRMARLPGNTDIVKLRVIGAQSLVTSFPLLVELNAGGHVSVRQYLIQRETNSYTVIANDERAARTRRAVKESESASSLSTPAPTAEKPVEKAVEKAETAEAKPVEKPSSEKSTEPEKVAETKPAEKASVTAQKTEAAGTTGATGAEEAVKAVAAVKETVESSESSETSGKVAEKSIAAVAATATPSPKVEEKTPEKVAEVPPVKAEVAVAPVVTQAASVTPARAAAPKALEPQRANVVPTEVPSKDAEKPAAEKEAVNPVESVAKTASMPSIPSSAKKSLSVADLPKHLQSKLRAPTVVREYVALNGFNPEESFPVKKSMTLWSIGQLYWPSYPGALLEQVVVALRDKNPKAFQNGDPSKIIVGSLLTSPDSNEVFSIDPLQAFRTIHGKKVAVPGPTQNLIDAQRLSRESAGEVAAAQITTRMQGGNMEAQTVAGREALDTWRAEHAEPTGATAHEVSDTPDKAVEAVEAVDAESAAVAPETAQSTEATNTANETTGTLATEETPAEKTAEKSEGFLARLNELKDNPDAQKWGLGGLAALVLLVAGGLFMRRRKQAAADENAEGAEQGVILQRRIEPTSEAQLRAVEATIDEAVKNGTTAGAMGAGAMAYTQAQMESDREEAAEETIAEGAPETDAEVALDDSASTETPETAEAKAEGESEVSEISEDANKHEEDELELGVPKDQPWLDPNDKELPPIDEEERQRDLSRVAEDRRRVANTLKEVNLELGSHTHSAPAEPDYIPPLMSEPVGTEHPAEEGTLAEEAPRPEHSEPLERQEVTPDVKAVKDDKDVKPAATPQASVATSAQPAKPTPEPIDEGRAQQEALDAKLQLANSFIDLGARDEARELLEEVRKKGTERQRENARRLLERVEALQKEEK